MKFLLFSFFEYIAYLVLKPVLPIEKFNYAKISMYTYTVFYKQVCASSLVFTILHKL